MYLFRKDNSVEIEDVKFLEDIRLFIVFFYIPYWYDCTKVTHIILRITSVS